MNLRILPFIAVDEKKEEAYSRLINDLTDAFSQVEATEEKRVTKKKEFNQKRELLGEIKDLLEKTVSQLDNDLPVKNDDHLPSKKGKAVYTLRLI